MHLNIKINKDSPQYTTQKNILLAKLSISCTLKGRKTYNLFLKECLNYIVAYCVDFIHDSAITLKRKK
jgi:hypothetical protein